MYIIAECAQGYSQPHREQCCELAKWMVKAAHSSCADAVKFQIVFADELSTSDYKYYELFTTLEMDLEDWLEVKQLADSLGIDLIFDVFGERSLGIVEQLQISTIKIHPTDFTNKRLLSRVASSPTVRNVLGGIGGSYFNEVVSFVQDLTSKNITLLHGFQGYPTPDEENWLNRLAFIKSTLEQDQQISSIKYGFADHADPNDPLSTHLAAIALGMGASVIEKHLTLSKCLQLEDYESALSPDEFKSFVSIIRKCERSMGPTLLANEYSLGSGELTYRNAIARHVVAKTAIKKGEIITFDQLTLKRTACDSPIYSFADVVGKIATRSFESNTPLQLDGVN